MKRVKPPTRVVNVLWGLAAGRCQFAGCNKILSRSSVTSEDSKIGEGAHIHPVGNGPRRSASGRPGDINELSNLMLLCRECHRLVDGPKGEASYPASLLLKMKREHEQRIELATGIAQHRRSHVLLYGANVGNHSAPLRYSATAPHLLPDYYPAERCAIELGMTNSAGVDRDTNFWSTELRHLQRKFDSTVRPRLAAGDIEHLSIFALAPQPLLMALGQLLTDIPQADVRQLCREPQSWAFGDEKERISFIVTEPNDTSGPPALAVSLSATITPDRIVSVLGPAASIWQVTVLEPQNDIIRSRSHIAEFRRTARRLLDQIKKAHGHNAVLNVFPAMPVSLAVELGRVHMPKADLRLRVFDEIREKGFVPAVEIPEAHS